MGYYKKIAEQIYPGLVIFLLGDIGAGKTTLVREMLSHRSDIFVTSPTYQIANIYDNSIVHMDMFRLGDMGNCDNCNCCKTHNSEYKKYLVHNCESESSLLAKLDMDYFLAHFAIFIEWPACNYFYKLLNDNDHIIIILADQKFEIINNSKILL